MEAPPEKIASAQVSPRDLLEIALKFISVLVLTTYVLGFLVVTLRNAAYGVVDFSVLKPRALAAGILLLFLTAVPVIFGLRLFGFGGLSTDLQRRLVVNRNGSRYAPFFLAAAFIVGCHFLAGLTSLLFVPSYSLSAPKWVLFPFYFLVGVALAAGPRRFANHPRA